MSSAPSPARVMPARPPPSITAAPSVISGSARSVTCADNQRQRLGVRRVVAGADLDDVTRCASGKASVIVGAGSPVCVTRPAARVSRTAIGRRRVFATRCGTGPRAVRVDCSARRRARPTSTRNAPRRVWPRARCRGPASAAKSGSGDDVRSNACTMSRHSARVPVDALPWFVETFAP